jgi:16S rRNA (adenine1518-N6/adenine1519-N6)-dimethyltransferase
VKARKRFGQHFLERPWADKIVQLVAPAAGDHLIEIGPGRGALTVPLAETGVPIHAIEIDRDLAGELSGKLPRSVSIITGDFLDISIGDLLAAVGVPAAPRAPSPPAPSPQGEGMEFEPSREEPAASRTERTAAQEADAAPPARSGEPANDDRVLRIVGNLPYNLSTPILVRLFALARETGRLRDATIMLQREVADRVTAKPGGGDWGPLGVLASLHADTDVLLQLPPGAFRPPPQVRSTVIRLRFRPFPVEIGDYRRFDTMVRTLFQQRRKTLGNALKPLLTEPGQSADTLRAAGLDPIRRPETLSLAELATLARQLG